MADKPRKIGQYEKQFGIIAVEKGFISAENLVEGLKTQVEEEIQEDSHRLIGEILVEKGHMTLSQIQEVLDDMFSG